MFSFNSPYDQLLYGVGEPYVRAGGHLETGVVVVALAVAEGLAGVLEEPARGRRYGYLAQVAKVLAEPAGRHQPDRLAVLLALGTVRTLSGTGHQPSALPPVVAKPTHLRQHIQKKTKNEVIKGEK